MSRFTYETSASGRALIRSPLIVATFTFVTLGLYGVVWWYMANRDLRDLGKRNDIKGLEIEPWKSALAVSLGLPIIVPAAVTLVRTCRRIELAERMMQVAPSGPTQNPFSMSQACLLTIIFPAAGLAYLQMNLNRIWECEMAIHFAPRQQEPGSVPSSVDT